MMLSTHQNDIHFSALSSVGKFLYLVFLLRIYFKSEKALVIIGWWSIFTCSLGWLILSFLHQDKDWHVPRRKDFLKCNFYPGNTRSCCKILRWLITSFWLLTNQCFKILASDYQKQSMSMKFNILLILLNNCWYIDNKVSKVFWWIVTK